ncbi:M20 aminoacylase family protein [Caballeronia sordidicola]|uniref:Catalyzes the cleavage of p-aminobenzoyl-glutamate to p-aminobenzoate and glutamate, subunit A n=1 Tax=Caballeronia sordidicola TaxID=196367 RepID=A0A226X773_CABSO|nr:M20 aminoacylase family protein [Caballeronia sordidicola]OXC79281.1 Catalyzes the cleavage of p-aminobenzoyl-glutamate to p-aminobenzoate and glutamate, subunit A [Caballeronia sordidicola]
MNTHTDMHASSEEMIKLRRRIHAYPELGYEEFITSDLIAGQLLEWGYEVRRGFGGTGVVGTLKAGGSSRSIGLRADMDALPLNEQTGLSYASIHPGKMHACGHDGHTAMLLGAAKQLAKSRAFNGTLNLIFQPAEEGLAGARRMLEEGVLTEFPCDAIFAMHNMPGFPAGKLGFRAGPFMASADQVTVRIIGSGGHGAMPHKAVDPIVVCAGIVFALQTIVSRNVAPLDMAVITIGAIHAGETSNVIPDEANMRISVRALRPEVRDHLEQRIRAVVQAQASVYGAHAEVKYEASFPVLVNDAAMTEFAANVARDWLGEAALIKDLQQLTASEDFAWFLQKCPGCYLIIGNGDGEGSCMVHNSGYDFNDDILVTGAGYWVQLVERFLA